MGAEDDRGVVLLDARGTLYDAAPLLDALREAVGSEAREDAAAYEIASSPLALRAYDPEALERLAEYRRWEARHRGSIAMSGVQDIVVNVVLTTVTAVVVKAAVEACATWLRGLFQPSYGHTVYLYGPNGEPLRKISIGRSGEVADVEPPWPLRVPPIPPRPVRTSLWVRFKQALSMRWRGVYVHGVDAQGRTIWTKTTLLGRKKRLPAPNVGAGVLDPDAGLSRARDE